MKQVLLICLFQAAVCLAGQRIVPDPNLTPGDALTVTTQTLCVPGYTKVVRHVPESLKKKVYEEYGIHYYPGIGRSYEVDHLISLELGGSNDIKNLWPEPYNDSLGANQKDVLENFLHRQVCRGEISLDEAQEEISTDWVSSYKKHFGK